MKAFNSFGWNYISLNCYHPKQIASILRFYNTQWSRIHVALLQFTLAHIVFLSTTKHQAIRKRNNSKYETMTRKDTTSVGKKKHDKKRYKTRWITSVGKQKRKKKKESIVRAKWELDSFPVKKRVLVSGVFISQMNTSRDYASPTFSHPFCINIWETAIVFFRQIYTSR